MVKTLIVNMKGINVIVVLFIVAASELARASENHDDLYSQVPSEWTLNLKTKTRRPRRTTTESYRRRTTTESYHTDTESTPETTPATTSAEPSSSTPDDVTNANPTTSEPTTTAPRPHCPDSLFTVPDLKVMIKHVSDESKVFESIKSSYQEDALKKLDSFNKTLAIFSEWFVEQPNHLKHILEDLSQRNKFIQTYINDITKDLKGNAVPLELFKEFQSNVSKLVTTTRKTKSFCEYSCQPQPLSKYLMDESVKEGTDDDYYCGKLPEVYAKIQETLNKFTANSQDELKTLLNKTNNEVKIKIEQLENKLKDIALNKFGRTMYDILNLIDGYHHLEKKSKVLEIHSMMVRNRENFTDLIGLLWRLMDGNKQIVMKCKQCRQDIALGSSQIMQNESGDLVDKLLDEHEIEITHNIMEDYNNIFKDLMDDLNLDNPEKVDKYMENVKKIQDEVNAMSKNEQDTLTKLWEEFPNQSIKDQKLIENGTEELFKTLDDVEKELSYIEHNIIH